MRLLIKSKPPRLAMSAAIEILLRRPTLLRLSFLLIMAANAVTFQQFIGTSRWLAMNDILLDSEKGPTAAIFECPMEPCHLNIVFMGDSISRYQYVSLVHFLRFNNTWIESTDSPNMVVAQTFLDHNESGGHWSHYYQQSMARLAPFENCDCFRNGKNYQQVTENRYFYDPTRNNTITYVQAFGSMPIHGHWMDPVEAARAPLHELVQGNSYDTNRTTTQQDEIPLLGPMPTVLPYKWEGGWEFVIESHISKIQPEVLILNAGKWPNQFHLPESRESLRNATQMAQIPRVIWKTTTASKGAKYTAIESGTDHDMCEIMECFNVSGWTKMVPPSLYPDIHHFYEPVYRKLNEELFSFLGMPILTPSLLEWRHLNLSETMIASA